MLKKIPILSLRLGMHIHKLEGAWMSHPFWKTRFVLDSAQDLAKLRDSGVTDCWIDNSLGLDVADPRSGPGLRRAEPENMAPVATPAAAAGAATAAAAASAATAAAPAPLASRGEQRPLAAEMREAAAICQRGREAVTAMFNEARMGRSIDANLCLPMVEDITQSVARNPGAMVSLARLKTKDDYSYMHSVAVCALMVALGRQMGLDDDECREAGLAGLMHDIGKALVPLDILNKPDRLTDAEFDQIRLHPRAGYELLREGGGASAATLDVVLHHHERFDGTGYPDKLAGEDISQLARMGSLCDVYDAITSNRPYKAGWDPAESIARMATWKGQFDPPLLAALIQSLGIYPIGSLVRLESGRLAVVLEQTVGNLASPLVKVFFSTIKDLPITPQVLDLSRANCQDRILGRAQRQPGQFPWLDDLWTEPDTRRRMSSAAPTTAATSAAGTRIAVDTSA